jgi:hypothetical protein
LYKKKTWTRGKIRKKLDKKIPRIYNNQTNDIKSVPYLWRVRIFTPSPYSPYILHNLQQLHQENPGHTYSLPTKTYEFKYTKIFSVEAKTELNLLGKI